MVNKNIFAIKQFHNQSLANLTVAPTVIEQNNGHKNEMVIGADNIKSEGCKKLEVHVLVPFFGNFLYMPY